MGAVVNENKGSEKDLATSQRVLSFLKPHRGPFLVALGCMVVFGVSEGGIPFLIKFILERVFASQDKSFLTPNRFFWILQDE